MTKDEIKLVTFIFLALVIGAAVQHFRTRLPLPPPPSPKPSTMQHGWAKPPYVLKTSKGKTVPVSDDEQ